MINIENAKLIRIKRANTDWWIGEKSVVGRNGKTYIAYSTDMGEIHVKEIDAKCSRAVSRDVCLCRLNSNYADEHNSPAICVCENGSIVVMYTGHAVGGTKGGCLRYRITSRPFDLDSFGEEKRLYFDGSVTYAQLSENVRKNELWLFVRVDNMNWSFSRSEDGGETWSMPFRFIETATGGQTSLYYLDIRKILNNDDMREYWFFAMYGHPRSTDHTIRAGLFNDEGLLLHMDFTPDGYSLKDGKSFNMNTVAPVYASPADTTVRLLEVSPTKPFRVGLATFRYRDPASTSEPLSESITYYLARYENGKGWKLSAPIASGGEFLAPGMNDGAQTYVGGMACYYGVGDAGYHPNDAAHSFTDRVYIARYDTEAKARVLESYVTFDRGDNYSHEQTIRSIPAQPDKPLWAQTKIWRPTVPIYAEDNLPVYWHEGTYSAHTGGWHSDALMFVEYDD